MSTIAGEAINLTSYINRITSRDLAPGTTHASGE